MKPTLAIVAGAALALALACQSASAQAARSVQIRSVDLTTNVIELHNFGDSTVPLDAWRFCTQDADEIARYTGSTGLNGVSLAPGASLMVHFDNDAAGPDTINRSDLGGVMAGPLGRDAYAISLYFAPVNFSSGATMADHVMWSIGATPNTNAMFRADEAQSGGVWTDQNAFVATTALSERIELTDTTGAALHGPADYSVVEPAPTCACDWNTDGFLNDQDFFDWTNDFFTGTGPAGQADFNDDGFENDQDFFEFANCFFTPPPAC